VLRQSIKILVCLALCLSKVHPTAFVLDDENARPKCVNEPATTANPLDMTLESNYRSSRYAKNFEELVVKRLRLTSLVLCA
jgi:hypothetical protein